MSSGSGMHSSKPPKKPDQTEKLKRKAEAELKEFQIEKQRKGELDVDNLPPELQCNYWYDFDGVRSQCPEQGTETCHRCRDIVCVAHVKSRVTTKTAKHVVRKGGKQAATVHESCFCVQCSADPEGNLIGKLNESFNKPGDYV